MAISSSPYARRPVFPLPISISMPKTAFLLAPGT
jgi:hypothetical protein